MGNDGLLTVIVPIYNSEKYLAKCLDSICRQRVSGLKIILVDDGSTDNSFEICKEYEKENGRISVIHKENEGPISARRCGVLACDTEYVTFVDSDDWLEDNAYEAVLPYLCNGIDVISFEHYMGNVKSSVQIHSWIREGFYSKTDMEEELYPIMVWNMSKNSYGLNPSLCNKVVKRDYYVRSYEQARELQFHYGEDIVIIYPLMQWINTFYHISKPLYHHRKWRNNQAAYVVDDDYFDHAYKCYCYLRDKLDGIPNAKKQIEYAYMLFADTRKRLFWHDEKSWAMQYIFPFDKVPKGSNIVIYGAGRVGKEYMTQLQKIEYCNVVAWIDQKKVKLNDIETITIEQFDSTSTIYDYVIVSVKNEAVKNEVYDELSKKSVPKEKIIWLVR